MSDEKPFARVEGAEGPSRFVMIGAINLMYPPKNGSSLDCVQSYADAINGYINSAVAARERKAAAKALREAATQFGAKSRTAKWINARAAALEGGA